MKKTMRATLQTPNTEAMRITMPIKPSDDVALFMSRLSFGFSPGERINDGKKEYKMLRDMIVREGLAAHNAKRATHVSV
jgi:hypothetical protein